MQVRRQDKYRETPFIEVGKYVEYILEYYEIQEAKQRITIGMEILIMEFQTSSLQNCGSFLLNNLTSNKITTIKNLILVKKYVQVPSQVLTPQLASKFIL